VTQQSKPASQQKPIFNRYKSKDFTHSPTRRFSMAEKATIKFRDIARESNASADQVKYWIKLLRIRPQIRGRTGYLTQPEAALLREMIQRVGEGESPKEAAEVLTDSVPVYPLDSSESSPSLVNIYETMGNMKEVLLVMATELRTTHEKMDIMTREVAGLRSENQHLHSQMLQLLPPKPPTQLSPNHAKAPLEGMTWWEKAWVKILHPERCRRIEESLT